MKTIILNHRVNNFGEWKKFYDSDTARRKNAGLREIAVGTKSDDRQEVYVVFQTENGAGIAQMMNDPELKEIMKKAGVIRGPEVVIVE